MKSPSLRDIELAVATKYGLTRDDMRQPKRARKYARPRQIAMYLSRVMTRASLPKIGTHYCRDHTTVLHSIRQIAALQIENPKVAAHVKECHEAVLAISSITEKVEEHYLGRLRAGEFILQQGAVE